MIRLRRGELLLRDFERRDVVPTLSYWYDAPREELGRMGIDVDRFPERAVRERFFLSLVGADPATAPAFALAGEIDGRTVGYALFNDIARGADCQGHVHVFSPEDRRRGLVSAAFAEGAPLVAKLLGVTRLVFEPSATNPAVNALLEKLGLTATQHYRKPARGICAERDVNRYEWRAS